VRRITRGNGVRPESAGAAAWFAVLVTIGFHLLPADASAADRASGGVAVPMAPSRRAAATPDSSWRMRAAKPVLLGDSTHWAVIPNLVRVDAGPERAPDDSSVAAELLAPVRSHGGTPIWRERGGLRLSFELCRSARLAIDAGDSATADSCWAALIRRPNPWRWQAVQGRMAFALAAGDSARGESLLVRAGPHLQNTLDQAEQQLALARLRAARGDSLRAITSLGPLLARWPSSPPAAAGITLFDSLSAAPRDSIARAFARRAAEVEALNGARSSAVRRLRTVFSADTSLGRRPASLELGLRIAELLRQTRRFGDALALTDTLERLAAPDTSAASRTADVMLARARTLRDAGRSEPARREYARAAAVTRDTSTIENAWWEIAREAEEQGEWGEARAAYARVDSLRRGHAAIAVIRRGILSYAEGDHVLARAAFARDTSMASRFWWAMAARDSNRLGADSVLALIASAPGFRYYSVCSRETLGVRARAWGAAGDLNGTRLPAHAAGSAANFANESLQLAHDLVLAGLLDDAAFLTERWALGDDEAGAPARHEHYRPRDLLDAAEIENACGRPAPAIRLARRAADEITRSGAPDSSAALGAEATVFQFPPAFEAEIARAAAAPHVGVESALLAALVWQESRFDSGAVSRAGARGLTQLMGPTASEMARQLHERAPPESLLNDPDVNLRYGARYFRTLLDRFGGRVPLALAAYNAGVPAAERWARLARGAGDALLCELIAYAETQDYVKSILAARAAYRELKPTFPAGARTPIR
jgi:soluble lytic murein transglycosylase-like protein/tetratricopeptide (TPR) repeat protein